MHVPVVLHSVLLGLKGSSGISSRRVSPAAAVIENPHDYSSPPGTEPCTLHPRRRTPFKTYKSTTIPSTSTSATPSCVIRPLLLTPHPSPTITDCVTVPTPSNSLLPSNATFTDSHHDSFVADHLLTPSYAWNPPLPALRALSLTHNFSATDSHHAFSVTSPSCPILFPPPPPVSSSTALKVCQALSTPRAGGTSVSQSTKRGRSELLLFLLCCNLHI